MAFIADLRQAIKLNQPIAPLLDSCIRSPKQAGSPLVSLAISVFGEEKVKTMVYDIIKDNLFNTIKENRNVFELLNSTEGRKYLHNQLDSLLQFLTSERFNQKYKCPSCHASFSGKCACCPLCKIALKWKS